MSKRHTCVHCKRKRNDSEMMLIEYQLLNKSVWICSEHASMIADIRTLRDKTEKPVFVELFSGSGHVSKAAQRRNYKTVTVDINPKFNPDICLDIHNLRRTHLPGNVHVMWVSIPCTVYSVLNLANHWEKVSLGYRQYYYYPKSRAAVVALRILERTISLIKQVQPLYFFIENPVGALRHIPHLRFVPYRRTVSYGDYGFDYLKPTDIFTNNWHFQPKKYTRANKELTGSVATLNSNYERSLIPPLLIDEGLDSVGFLEK